MLHNHFYLLIPSRGYTISAAKLARTDNTLLLKTIYSVMKISSQKEKIIITQFLNNRHLPLHGHIYSDYPSRHAVSHIFTRFLLIALMTNLYLYLDYIFSDSFLTRNAQLIN